MNTDRHRFLFGYFRLSALICGFIILFSVACFQTDQNSNKETDENTVVEIPKPEINLAEPLKISEKEEDVALAKRIDEIIEQKRICQCTLGNFCC